MIKENVKNYWDQIALTDGNTEGINVGTLHKGNELQAFFRKKSEELFIDNLLKFKNNSLSVLEIGTGGGRWAIYLANKGHKITAIDISDKMIEIAKKSALESAVDNIVFHTIDPLDFLQVYNEKFDFIYFSGMLMYLEDHDIKELLILSKKRLKPGGFLVGRETLVKKRRFVSAGAYPVIYRTEQEYKKIAEQVDLDLTIAEKAYYKMRFSGLISRLKMHRLFGYRVSNFMRLILLALVKVCGDPSWLKNKDTLRLQEIYGELDHKFMVFK